jgi:hypothetical protein
MTKIKEVKLAERIFFEIQKIKKQIVYLEDFVVSQLQDQGESPKINEMVDPRTGKPFQK